MSDPTRIHQIIMNLCTNASQAMSGNGGVLEVGLSDVEVDSVLAAKYPELDPGSYLQLIVSDTGCGMSQDILNRIFEPFFTTKQQGEGTGMGLSVVHGIVESCDGEIYAYSEIEKGSSFTVFLPIAIGIQQHEQAIETALPIGTERILFVDDEPALAEIGQQMLEQLGYNVTSTTNPNDALALFKASPNKYDLVITDMTMPEMTGERLIEELFTIRSDIPVILCTGFSPGLNAYKAKALGINGFLMKPIILSEIAGLIRNVLESIDSTNKNFVS